MNLTNLLRDQVHAKPEYQFINLSGYSVMGKTCLMNSNAVVNQTEGNVYGAGVTTSLTNSVYWQVAGLYMSYPVVDATPYRVKARVQAYLSDVNIIVGYGPLAPTAIDDTITKVVPFPIASLKTEFGEFDEVIMMPGLKEGHQDFGKPIAFGVAVSSTATGAHVSYNLSVQNLARTAPQFAASMS